MDDRAHRAAKSLRSRLQCKGRFHLHVCALHPHFHASHADLRIFRPLTGTDVESPPVPGAFDPFTIHASFAERSACMRACIIDDMKGSVDITEGEKNSLDFNGAAGARRNLVHLGDGDIVGLRIHKRPLQVTAGYRSSQYCVTS